MTTQAELDYVQAWGDKPEDEAYFAGLEAVNGEKPNGAPAARSTDSESGDRPFDATFRTRAEFGVASPRRVTDFGSAARLERIADVQRESVDWRWLHRIPDRKTTVVEGDPGLGKSTLLTDIAARVTTGKAMPGTELDHEPAGVVILTAEDGLGDTVRPRLEAAGADLFRVAALTAIVDDSGDRMPYLPDDLAHVEQAALDMRAGLIVIDPLMAYLSGDVNSHRDQDVRRALAPIAAMAERTGAAVVVIRHLNKSSGASALYRGGGSIGITGAARAVLLVAPDPEDDERRILAVSKSNLAPIPPALAYRLVSDSRYGCARVEWDGPTEHRASELLAVPNDEARDARREAVDFLRDVLTAPLPAVEVRKQARQNGIADRTLDRAKKDAGVVSERQGFGPGSQVYWHIGRHTSPAPEGRPMASYGVEADYPASAWADTEADE